MNDLRVQHFPKLTFYKGVTGKFGALQIQASYDVVDKNNEVRKSGPCVFINAAPTTGLNQYDWKDQQITISLALADLTKIIKGLRCNEEVKIYHDTSKREGTANAIKSLNINFFEKETAKGKQQGFMFNFLYKGNGKEIKFTVPISLDESISIISAFESAIAVITGFAINPNEVERQLNILNTKINQLLTK